MTGSPIERPFDPFEDFDRLFEDMRRRMYDMVRDEGVAWYIETGSQQARRKDLEPSHASDRRKVPLVQDGEFRIVESDEEPEDDGVLVDVVERGGSVLVMMEMPGICSENVHAGINGKKLRLDIDARDGRLVKTVELPCSVRSSSLVVNCRNGVLVAEMERQPSRKPRKRVKDPSLN